MPDINTRMGVSGVSQFKQGMTDAQASVKTFDAALKANEKQLKATGNAENYMQAQTTLLTGKLKEQEKIAKNAEQALKQMEANGVRTTSKSYQDMQRKLIEAQSAMLDTQMELDGLGAKAADATGKTDKLGDSLGGLNKKVSLDQVISGVEKITSGLENAAKKAADLGEQIFNAVMDKAAWADDTATMAQMYGIDLDTFLKMQGLVANGLDTSVEAILKSQKKLRKGIGEESKGTMDTLKELGLAFTSGKGESMQLVTNDELDLMFRAGQALMQMNDAFDKEAAAQSLFGRSWEELIPLFDTEHGGYENVEEYRKALEGVNTASEEEVNALAELNDKMATLEHDLDVLGTKIMATLAPALTSAAEALDGLLTRVLEYLDTPEGQKALEDLSTAVEGLFSDMGSIDPDKVVEGFTGVITSVTTGVQWLVDNVETVKGILGVIVGAWVTSNATIAGLEIMKLIQGIQGLTGAGAAAAAGQAGTAVGASWGAGFAGAVLKAAPWLLFLYETLKPSEGSDKIGNNTLVDENGNLTREALEYGYQLDENGEVYQDRREILEKAAQEAWDLMRTGQLDKEALIRLQDTVLNNDAFTAMAERFMEMRTQNPTDWMNIEDIDMADWVEKYGVPEIPAEIAAPDDTAEMLEEEIGTVDVTAVVHFVDDEGNSVTPGSFDAPPTHKPLRRKKANGIWSVPFDGYTAVLHKGEQVIPARQVANSRTLNSNLYVESMYMNNGMDAEGLAAAMAAANRRTMRGYGS